MKLKHIALAAALAVGVAPAFAVPTEVATWGVHNAGGETYTSGILGLGLLDQVITFSLNNSYVTSAAAVTLSFLTYLDITGGSVALYANNGSSSFEDDALVQTFGLNPNSTTFSFGTLSAGSYFYRVTGNSTGSLGGSYLLGSSISPVPEPGTYALLFAGLGVVGFVASRRRPQQ